MKDIHTRGRMRQESMKKLREFKSVQKIKIRNDRPSKKIHIQNILDQYENPDVPSFREYRSKSVLPKIDKLKHKRSMVTLRKNSQFEYRDYIQNNEAHRSTQDLENAMKDLEVIENQIGYQYFPSSRIQDIKLDSVDDKANKITINIKGNEGIESGTQNVSRNQII
mmetsp:Transcript_12393/g.10983  ORF Transcript_12393/g.10983 Transcript_12393/m.10983 type:complete len:166 (-) Transcript_12393:33-530(-)